MIVRKNGYFKTQDGAELYYEVHGDKGPAIVLTYGLACLFNHWHFQVDEFSKTHQVILYDIRGHHKSSKGELEPTVDLLAQDAVELSKFLGFKKSSFWGHSFGVPISLRVGSIYEANTESLVLINGFYSNPFSEILSDELLMKFLDYLKAFSNTAPELSKWLWKNGIDNIFAQYIAGVAGGFNLERVPFKDIEIYTKGVAAIDIETFCDHFSSLLKFDGSKYFTQTSAKTLIIHGKRDGLIPIEQSVKLNEGLKNSKLVVFDEGSHCTQLDLPHKVNQEITQFLHI